MKRDGIRWRTFACSARFPDRKHNIYSVSNYYRLRNALRTCDVVFPTQKIVTSRKRDCVTGEFIRKMGSKAGNRIFVKRHCAWIWVLAYFPLAHLKESSLISHTGHRYHVSVLEWLGQFLWLFVDPRIDPSTSIYAYFKWIFVHLV